MRRRLLVGMALLLWAPSLVAQAIPVSVGGQTSSLLGVAMDVPLQFDLSARPEKLGSFALRLSWNPAVLQFLEGANGSFGPVSLNLDSIGQGVLRVSGANPAGVGGRVTVGLLHFLPIAITGDTLRLSVSEAYAAGTFVDLLPSIPGGGASTRIYCPARGRWGDIDQDGVANSRDALLALSASVGLTVSAGDATLGDVDGDNAVNARDALIILSFGVGLPVTGFRVFGVAPGSCVAPVVVGLSLDPGPQTLIAGQHVAFQGTFTDPSGDATTITDLVWHTSNASVVQVSSGGTVQAVGTGSALVSGVRANGDSAAALITVINRRTVHWVDALAYNARVQLGTNALPFDSIQTALDLAQPGDTVRVRSGRYTGSPTIRQSVVVLGDSIGNVPVVSVEGDGSFAFGVEGGQRVELAYFAIDTVNLGIHVFAADTVVVRSTVIRTASFDQAGISVDTVQTLRLVHSSLFGGGGLECIDPGLLVNSARVVAIDSSVISGHCDYGAELYNVDSLMVRGSSFTGNGESAIELEVGFFTVDTAHYTAAVLSHNRFIGNNGGVILDGVRSARLDHNVFSAAGCCEDVIGLTGHGGTLLSIVGDSVDAGDHTWLDISRFDSLMVDSVQARVHEADGFVSGGRVAAVMHSSITTYENDAFDVDPGSRDSTLFLLRSVTFSGWQPSECDQCSQGISGFGTTVIADSIVAINMDDVFDMDDHELRLTHATMTHVFTIAFNDCDGIRLDHVTATDVPRPVEAFGYCQPGDTVLVDHSSFTSGTQAIETGAIPLVVRNSTFSDFSWGIEADSSLVVQANAFLGVSESALSYGGDGASDTVLFSGNTVTCNIPGASQATAVSVKDAAMSIIGNTITNCYRALDLQNRGFAPVAGIDLMVRSNVINIPLGAAAGISVIADGGRALVVANSVNGPASEGSIALGSFDGIPTFAQLDSNTVSGAAGVGILGGIADQLFVRDNVVLDTRGASCCATHGAIVQQGSSSTNLVRQILRNRISGSKTNGIVLASDDGDTVTTLIDSNTVKGVDSIGVWISLGSGDSVTFNSIDSTGLDAIQVTDDFSHPATVITLNNITRSQRYGVNMLRNESPLPATANWWGDAIGPRGAAADNSTGVGDSVSFNVDFSSPLGSPALAPPALAPRVLAGLRLPAASPTIASAKAAPRATTSSPVPTSSAHRVAQLEARRQRLQAQALTAAKAVPGGRAPAAPVTNANLTRQLSRVTRELQRANARATPRVNATKPRSRR